VIRALIVDDEKPGRERLRELLADDSRFELVACCASGDDALEILRTAARRGNSVQLMFLDVQMPELDGFGVLSAIAKEAASVALPAVIFVTAHDEYALRAFDTYAINYLLKPFSDERFEAALDRAAIVNIDVVVELRQDEHGDYVAVLRDRPRFAWGGAFGFDCKLDSGNPSERNEGRFGPPNSARRSRA